MYPDKMDKFYVHNDSTASLYVDKPASYTLKQVLEDFSDDCFESYVSFKIDTNLSCTGNIK